MATLTNPINAQNIVDRYHDYVLATARAGIVWSGDAKPFPEFDIANMGGYPTTFGPIGPNVAGAGITATPITASNIFNRLCQDTQSYSHVRNLRALLNVTGGGGNSGSRPTAGIVFDQTAVTWLSIPIGTQTQVNPANPSVSTGNAISAANLETLFDRLRTVYTNNYRATVRTLQTDVCHASCHSNCHGSRGRR